MSYIDLEQSGLGNDAYKPFLLNLHSVLNDSLPGDDQDESSNQPEELFLSLLREMTQISPSAQRKILEPSAELSFDRIEFCSAPNPVPELPEEAKPAFAKFEKLVKERFSKDPELMKKFTDAAQELYRSTNPGNDNLLTKVALGARLAHVNSLLEAGCSSEMISQALARKLEPKANAIDAAGVFDVDFKNVKFGASESPNHYLFNYVLKGADGKKLECMRDQTEGQRKPEIWQVQVTEDSKTGSFICTVTRDGARVEGWVVQRTDDGAVKVKGIDGPDPKPDTEGLTQAREKLFTAVSRSSMTTAEKMEMIRDLTQIEYRARVGDLYKSPVGTRVELAQTYQQIERVLSDTAATDVPKSLKVVVARQLTRELADPGDIDQGAVSDACRIASAQYRLAIRRPSVVARVTVDALLEGKVRFQGKEVKLDDSNRKPSSHQSTQFPRLPDERSFASQLFQVASMNALGHQPEIRDTHLYYTNRWGEEKNLPKIEPCDSLEFVQRHEKSEIWVEGKDGKEKLEYSGERRKGDKHPYLLNNGMEVYTVKNGKRQQLITQTKEGAERKDGGNHILLQAYGSQAVLNLFDPGVHKSCVLAHRDMVKYTRQGPGDDNSGPPASRTMDEMVSFDDVEDLKRKVLDAKAKGNLPIIIASMDYGIGKPFHKMEKGALRGEFESTLDECDNTHIMIIRDIIPGDPAKGTSDVLVTDDFFGKNYDRRVLPKSEWQTYFMKCTQRAR